MPEPRLRYVAYVRKSTESEERQVLSIETQVRKAREMFPGLCITDTRQERASAFEPGKRPVFDGLIDDIDQGKVDGIIAWHPDRLSRNEEDAAKLTYRVRKGVIKDLRFCSYNFDNSPEGIMMLQLALSQSQYFSAKLSKDVKRGIEQKLVRGERPGRVVVGYLNDPLTKTVRIDSDRFTLVQRMWLMMLTGQYSPMRIADIANREWGYRSPIRRNSGGRPMARSSVYQMFRNPFYAGYMLYDGELYKGSHTPMITLEQFDRIQALLPRRARSRKPIAREFAYTGLIRCGSCGAMVTAQVTNGYVYYHCTHRKSGVSCPERANVREEHLERRLADELSKYTVHPAFQRWALAKLERDETRAGEERRRTLEMQERTLTALDGELDTLIRLRSRDLIDDEEFIGRRDALRAQRLRLREQLAVDRTEAVRQETRKAVNFASEAAAVLRLGPVRSKQAIAMSMGTNYVLKDRELTFTPAPWLVPMRHVGADLNSDLLAFEPAPEHVQTNGDVFINEQTAAFATVCSQWCSILDEVQTELGKELGRTVIPNLGADGQGTN